MTAPEVRAETSTTRRVEPPEGAIPATVPRPALRKSQALADEAATEIRRIDLELAELATRESALLAEKIKLLRVVGYALE